MKFQGGDSEVTPTTKYLGPCNIDRQERVRKYSDHTDFKVEIFTQLTRAYVAQCEPSGNRARWQAAHFHSLSNPSPARQLIPGLDLSLVCESHECHLI